MNNREIAEALRQRARELADNRDRWVQQEPEAPGTMCALWNYDYPNKRAVHDDAIKAMEQWLPGYVAQTCPERNFEDYINGSRMDITFFNDSVVDDVDEVIVAFEKCAAELG